jgi:hypothetical protein
VLLLAAMDLIALLLVGLRLVDEPMVELRAFAGLVREFCPQSGEFVFLRASPGVNPSTRRLGCSIRPASGRLGSWWRG